MSEKLDNFSKILLATSTINYMAASLNSANEQIKMVLYANRKEQNDIAETMQEGIVERTEKLESVVADLCDIINRFGNFLNNIDAVCPIDERIYKAPIEILIDKKDDVDFDYDNEDFSEE